jgi:hypothetical protein
VPTPTLLDIPFNRKSYMTYNIVTAHAVIVETITAVAEL